MAEEMERLEHEPDAAAAQPGSLPVGQLGDLDAVEAVGARRRGCRGIR